METSTEELPKVVSTTELANQAWIEANPDLVEEILEGYYLTVEEAAVLLGISRKAVHGASDRGRLHPIKVGRRSMFPRDQIEAYRQIQDRQWDSKQEAQAFFARFPENPKPGQPPEQ